MLLDLFLSSQSFSAFELFRSESVDKITQNVMEILLSMDELRAKNFEMSQGLSGNKKYMESLGRNMKTVGCDLEATVKVVKELVVDSNVFNTLPELSNTTSKVTGVTSVQ